MSIQYNEKTYLLPIETEGGAISDFIESAEKVLESHEDYKQISNEYKFRSIKIYVSTSKPHYQANLIYEYLYPGKKDFHTWVRKFRKIPEHECKFLIKQNIVVKSKTNPEKDLKKDDVVLLTELGLMRAFGTATTDFAILFQELLLEFLRNIRTNHEKIWKKCMESARDRYQEAEHLNKRNIQIQEAFINPDDTDVQNHTELTILRRENMKQYYVYLADWKYVNTRYWKTFPQKDKKPTTNAVKKLEPPSDSKYEGIDLTGSDSDTDDSSKIIDIKKKIIFDESDPHPDGLQEEYDLYNTDLRDIKNNENDDYYIYISTKEVHQSKKQHFKFLRFIYVKDTKHYKEMMDYIANGKKYNNDTSYTVNNDLPEIEYIPYHVETAYKGVYQLNYSNLIDARNSSFINLHKATLDLHKSEKRNKRK
jgi:hypothetical protein